MECSPNIYITMKKNFFKTLKQTGHFEHSEKIKSNVTRNISKTFLEYIFVNWEDDTPMCLKKKHVSDLKPEQSIAKHCNKMHK